MSKLHSDKESNSGMGVSTEVSCDMPPPNEWIGNKSFLWIYAGFMATLLLRLSVMGFVSGDYWMFLRPWYDYLIEHGRWASLAQDFSNYSPLYLYLLALSTFLPIPQIYAIKGISLLSDYLMAIYIYKLVRYQYATGTKPWIAALVVLMLPTVWWNSALWGQCDAMFTTGLLACTYYLIVNRPAAAMIGFGLACALKPQSIFLVPFLLGYAFRTRMHWRYLAIPPLVCALCGVPAMLAGKPIFKVLFHWFLQKNHQALTVHATNWYQWIPASHYEVFFMPGVLLTCIATMCLIYTMNLDAGLRRVQWVLTTSLLSVLMVPFLLPGMHERYFFAADIFSVIYAFYATRGWIIMVMIQVTSFFSYFPFLFRTEPMPLQILSLVMTGAIAWVAVDLIRAIVLDLPQGNRSKEHIT